MLVLQISFVYANSLNLEQSYTKGFYLSQQGKHQQAFVVMQTLAKKNYPPAVQNIALSYYHGFGIKKNKKLAEKYFLQAHNFGILDATNELANIYYQRKDNIQAVQFWQIASEKNNEYATYNLAMFHLENGNNKLGKQLLLKAAELNHPQANNLLKKLKL